MNKQELYEENAALRMALIELRALIDETLASYTPDEDADEEGDPDQTDLSDDDED